MNVYQSGPNQYAIVWNPDKVSGTATLERSDHHDEGWVTAADVTGLSTYTDEPNWVWSEDPQTPTPPKIRSQRLRTWYWRIVHDGSTLGPARIKGTPDGIAFEVARLATRHLKRDVKTQAYLIRRPTYGEHCADCWDPIRNQRTRTNCDTCNGTGRDRGWGSAISVFASFAIEQEQPEQVNTMRFNQLQLPIWMANDPIVAIGDYILRRDDLELFEVVRWQPTLRRGFIIRQNLMGRLLEKNDNLYESVAAIVA